MQTKLQSFTESCANTAIGLAIATAANYYVLPLRGYRPSIGDSLEIAIIFTIIALVRSYTLRRLFNYLHRRS